MANLLWMQAGACSGDSMSLLTADGPSIESLIRSGDIELLWHPSLSIEASGHFAGLVDRIERGEQALDILCIEGSIVTGPYGSGMFDSHRGRPKMQIAAALAARARIVVAVGTCAAFGGVHAAPPNPADCIGLQYDHAEPGGLLGEDWRSGDGLPVINLAGCPVHPLTITRSLAMLASGIPVELDFLHRPKVFYSSTVHQGCTRNEYHEYDVEDHVPGGKACMYFNLGCQGPGTLANCNAELWNNRSSKTRAGVPCFGCTSPDFPRDGDLFRTDKIGEIPITLPLGVARPRYMAYKNLAKAAAPDRLIKREMEP